MTATVVQFRSRLLAVPFSRPIGSPHYRFTHLHTILCEATDGDETGCAGLWFANAGQARVVLEGLRYLAPYAAAHADPSDLGVALRREINFLGYKGVTVIAMSGLEMAVQDMVARSGRSPLPAALRDTVPAYWSGFFLTDSLESWLAEAELATSRGFRAFKARLGRPTLGEDLERVAALRSTIGPSATLMLDPNQAWDLDTALAASRALAVHDVKWLEDPLVHSDYEGLEVIVRESPIPVATGENEYLREGFTQLLDAGVTYLLADLERVGGIGEWQAVADLALRKGAILTPHLYPQMAVGLCSRLLQAETWVEYVDWWDPLMTEPLVCIDGAFSVSTGPGLGFRPDPDAIERYAMSGWEELT